ncbi:SusC/RagA family TonB-linked outer membrane protein [Parapedobacter composti]|nr:SusC/RagA family TonB-linked outer membrane protein [Parapedobacter composti]
MKISIFLLLVFVTAGHAKSMAQKISLSLKDTNLETVFSAITSQTKHRFLYSDDVVKKAGTVNVELREASIEEALDQVLKNRRLTYRIIAETVIINEEGAVGVENILLAQQTVSGVVRDANGQTLSGVTVSIKGQPGSVATTNAAGGFRVAVPTDAVLVFTYIGYQTREINVAGNTVFNVVMEEAVRALEEVVTTGYQNINRRKFTGAATTLKADDAQRAGIPDVSRMLEGQVAGVAVQNVSGTFGAAPKIRIRGATSITGENKPLWVVDGIILEDVVNVSNDQLSTGDATTLLGSSVAGINPDDIESFQILKDAAATSLYGARAMNGVILITTKRGRAGVAPVISYTANLTSFLKPSYSQFDIVNSYDQMSIYAELERKGAINYTSLINAAKGGAYTKLAQGLVSWNPDGTPAVMNTPSSRREFLEQYVYANTNWFDALFKNSLQQEHSLSVTSGTEKTQMYYSTSYLQDNGWTVGNRVQRFTGNIRGDFQVNDKLSFGLITTGSIRDQNAPGTLEQDSNPVTGEVSRDFDINPFSYALNTSRIIRPYDNNGNYEFFTMNYAPFNILHELQNNSIELNMVDLKIQGEVNYKLPKNIKYNFLGAYRYVNTGTDHKITENSNLAHAYRAGTTYGVTGRENSTVAQANRFLYTNPDDPDGLPITVLPYGGMYLTRDNSLKSYYLRNSFNWDATLGDAHYVTAFLTQELRYLDRMQKSFTGYGYQFNKGGVPFLDPRVIRRDVEANQVYYAVNLFQDRYVAFAANSTYSYKGKYQLTGTLRYDGSNQLGESRTARWLPTWNLSGSWNIDEEAFMKRQSFFDALTVRGTYGLTASMGDATNSSLVVRSANTTRPYLPEIEPVLNIENLANSDLTWEKQYEANVGVDAQLWSRRLQVTVDLYNRNAFDLIGGLITPGIGGEQVKFANYADMKSRGIELLVRAEVIKGANWNWKTQLTNAFNKAEITRLSNRPMIWDLVSNIGGAKVGFPHRGLFSIDFERLNEEQGVPQYVNEDGTISNNVYLQSTMTDYLRYEGPVDPTFNGGFFNTVRYKNFNASVLLTYSMGNKVRLNPIYKNSYSDLDAMSYDFLSRFVLPYENLAPGIADLRTESRLPGDQVYNAYNYSNARVADGGFARLKQVTVGYEFPKRVLKDAWFKNLSVTLVANNLWLIYSDPALNGQDPEFYGSGGVALPIPRQFTLSLKANL